MKIATFNANSIRVRLPILQDWIATHEPDVLAIQETKCEDGKFPASDFEDMGYHVVFSGQKTYNGVALICRSVPQNVTMGFPDPVAVDDKRIIAATVDGVRIINTYVPNGTKVGTEKFTYKLEWLDKFEGYLSAELAANPNLVWLGDINIAPTRDDVFDPVRTFGGVGFHPEELSRLQKLIDLGMVDLFRKFTPEGNGHYTFWEFVIPRSVERNLGWRIDHIYASPALATKAESCVIDKEPRRLPQPSDHTFVVAEISV